MVLGEYSVSGATPWVAALAVPLAAGEALSAVGGTRRRWVWPVAGAVAAAGLAWGVWLSTGRGVDPWPAGGSVAVVAGGGWPAVLTLARARRAGRRPGRRFRPDRVQAGTR